jgi:4-hydroxy-3-methylbut-2-enyl diphosphate reductase
MGQPVYVRHEIAQQVRSREPESQRRGFVEDLHEVPANAITRLQRPRRSQKRGGRGRGPQSPVLNATCPLVTKVHNQGKRYVSKGRKLVLIGHEGHPEVVGTMGRFPALSSSRMRTSRRSTCRMTS